MNLEGYQALQKIVFTLLTLVLISCSSTDMSGTPESREPVAVTMGNADSLWQLRADTTLANMSLQMYQQLADSDSNSVEVWAKLSRAIYYCGQYLTQNPQLKDSLFIRGYEISQAVLNQNKGYRNLLFSTGDESIAVRGLGDEFIGALYWGLANYGQWLSTKSSLVRMGRRELVWATLEHIHELDSTYFYGAYYRFKGALLGLDPESEDDTQRIKRAFDEAIRVAPNYFGTYTLMAKYYCRKANDRDMFYKLLTKVITSTPNEKLPYFPENMYERVQAEKLMIKSEKEHWFD